MNIEMDDIIATYPMEDNSTHYSKCLEERPESVLALQIIIMAASSLSILGALAIILMSYCKGNGRKENLAEALHETARLQNPETHEQTSNAIVPADDTNAATDDDVRKVETKEKATVRYPARFIIACISLADIIAAASHIWGVSNNYANLEHTSIDAHGAKSKIPNISTAAESTECGAQAVLAIFGTISSFLWSDLLALMAVVMLYRKKWFKPSKFISYRAFVVYNIICWGIPLLVVCVLGGMNAIGFEEGVDVGWCYIHAHYHKKSKRLWWLFFSYELWDLGSMLWILLMVLMFCTIFCAKKIKEKRIKDTPDEQRQLLIESQANQVAVDEKMGCCKSSSKPLIMIIVAASLIILRIWDTFLDFLLFRSIPERSSFHCTLANAIIVAFAGFGNSSQGLVNFIIFIVFTGQLREIVCYRCTYGKQRPAVL